MEKSKNDEKPEFVNTDHKFMRSTNPNSSTKELTASQCSQGHKYLFKWYGIYSNSKFNPYLDKLQQPRLNEKKKKLRKLAASKENARNEHIYNTQ